MNQNLTGGSVGFNPLNALLTYINPALSFAVKGFNTLGNQFSQSWKDWRESDNFQQFLNRRKTGTTITNPAVLGNYLPSNINYTFNTDDHLIADTTYDKQKEMLENILNTEDTEIDEYLKNKEQKDERQQELLNQILTG
jgi:hypothetical protein